MVDMGIIPGHAFDFHFDYGEELLCRLFNYADGQVNVNLVLLKQNRGANALNAQCFATRLNTLIHVQWTRFHERAALLRLKVSLSHYKMH